jgi:serine/threonine protein kinase
MVGGLSLLSPELKTGKPPSASSDLYAYGCLFLWVCCFKIINSLHIFQKAKDDFLLFSTIFLGDE